MTEPTDTDLNRAMADAVGWTHHPAPASDLNLMEWLAPDGSWHPAPPDFCRDRNALPAILDTVEDAGKQWSMAVRLDKDISKGVVESAWIMWRLPMREVVEAALRALGKWPADWERHE